MIHTTNLKKEIYLLQHSTSEIRDAIDKRISYYFMRVL
jgi:hypothetical protein